MTNRRFNQFVTLLCELPIEAWNASITDSSFKSLKPHSEAWPFGRFAALYVLLGLNDYKTRGRAEVGYWPMVVPLVPPKPAPTSPRDLREMLQPFFQTERVGAQKVSRLACFTESPLCSHLWKSDAASIAADFQDIWPQLARTMNQRPEKKTIAFAMKCLAFALIIVGETGFDYGAIPVPIDLRVRELSRRLGLGPAHDDDERARWMAALKRIRNTNPQVTMGHLDSILWHIGTLARQQLEVHLLRLGTPQDLARRIACTVDGS